MGMPISKGFTQEDMQKAVEWVMEQSAKPTPYIVSQARYDRIKKKYDETGEFDLFA